MDNRWDQGTEIKVGTHEESLAREMNEGMEVGSVQNLVRVEFCHYEFAECCRPSQATVTVRGHITDTIAEAHRLLWNLFGNVRWRIYNIEYHQPADHENASNGTVTVYAHSL